MSTTIKEQLLDEIRKHADPRGRLQISPDELGKRYGLNGHDLVKNLEQLRQQGYIHVQWGAGNRIARVRLQRGQINLDLLARRAEHPANLTTRILDWLRTQPTEPGGWVRANTASVRDALHDDRVNLVATRISQMTKKGLLELRKEGRYVTHMRPATAPPSTTAARQIPVTTTCAPTPTPATGLPATPNLDRYIAARRIARLAPAENPYLEILFDENPIAEEAIALLDYLKGRQ